MRAIFRSFLGDSCRAVSAALSVPGSHRNNGVKCLAQQRWGPFTQCLLFTEGVPAPGSADAVPAWYQLVLAAAVFKDKNNLDTFRLLGNIH